MRSMASYLFALSLLLPWTVTAHAAELEHFNDGPSAGGPFSEATRIGDTLYLSGQLGTDASGGLVAGGMTAEADQLLRNIAATLERRNLAMTHVMKCTVFLADISEWGTFNEVYKRHFAPPYPARSALGASGLALNARVEMECIAGIPG